MRARCEEILRDLGTDPSALTRAQVESYARAEIVAAFLWERLQTQGPLTAKGRTRAALNAWLQVIDRLHRSAVMLGLERRAKRMPSLGDAINGR